jgi:hypothetical protein
MGAQQRAAITPPVTEACTKVHPNGDAPALCATFTARNRAGDEVWIQVLAGNINMAYPFTDDPVARFRHADAFGPLKADLIDWQADTYATWETLGIAPRDVAFLVDRFFTTVLDCDDATYAPTVAMEDLDA